MSKFVPFGTLRLAIFNLLNPSFSISLKEGQKNLNNYHREKEESLKRSRHLQENPQIMEDKEKVSRSAEKMGEFLINTKLCVLNAQNRFLSIIQKLIPIDD